MFQRTFLSSDGSRSQAAWYVLGLVLAIFTYWYGLGSDHIPKNGDEFPYAHITRVTAATGRLLPLKSEIESLRNTKPPLLFWQGIASTNWGKEWSLTRLRYPSVIYTLLTGGLVFLLAAKLSGRWTTGCLAFLIFLGFFSTYRYGRPFLTDPPDVFWLFLPFFALLFWQPRSFESRLLVPGLLGLTIGIGLLYKSFALAVPVILGLSWWYLSRRKYDIRSFLVRDAGKLLLMGCLALAVFAMWFVLDPNPKAILREFVFGENVGKFDTRGGGYIKTLLWGGSSIWSLALGYPLNAGLLALPVVALMVISLKDRERLEDAEKLLWFWVIALFIVFSLPSQRSERYLLPAMPTLAVLCALRWEQVSRSIFRISLIVAALVIAVIGYLSIRLQQSMGTDLFPATYWALLACALVFVILSCFLQVLTRPGLIVASLLACLCFAAFLRPFDGPLGTYSAEARQFVRGRDVWVPVNFKAKEEGYLFLLPGANVHPYTYDRNLTASALSKKHSLFVFRQAIKESDPDVGTIVGRRLELGSRHTSSQIKEMLLGKVYEHLFLKELLINAAPGSTNAPP